MFNLISNLILGVWAERPFFFACARVYLLLSKKGYPAVLPENHQIRSQKQAVREGLRRPPVGGGDPPGGRQPPRRVYNNKNIKVNMKLKIKSNIRLIVKLTFFFRARAYTTIMILN